MFDMGVVQFLQASNDNCWILSKLEKNLFFSYFLNSQSLLQIRIKSQLNFYTFRNSMFLH